MTDPPLKCAKCKHPIAVDGTCGTVTARDNCPDGDRRLEDGMHLGSFIHDGVPIPWRDR